MEKMENNGKSSASSMLHLDISIDSIGKLAVLPFASVLQCK